MKETDWRQDPRLKGMDPKKLKYLTDFAEKAGKTCIQPRRAGISFWDVPAHRLLSIYGQVLISLKKQVYPAPDKVQYMTAIYSIFGGYQNEQETLCPDRTFD